MLDHKEIPRDGFILVASRDRLYYELALNAVQSLKDYYPNSHVTLFAHKNFLDDRAKIFDNIITDIPIHKRAKMWCMARTPYERTVYIDVDCLIRHRDIAKIHDFLDECDMFFGSHLHYTTLDIKWSYIDIDKKIPVQYHGSMCGYRKSSLTLDFMQTWFDEYIAQVCSTWPYTEYYKEWQQFDMFTLWRMTCKKFEEFKRFDSLNIKLLDRRWNNTIQDRKEDVAKKPVITQIDRFTWMAMEDAWEIIRKGATDKNYTVNKSPVTQVEIEYN